MTSGSAFAGTAGAVLLLAGLALLVVAWRRRKQSRGLLIAGGWGLMLLSMWPWVVFGGPDRGVAIAISVLTLAAFAIVMRNGAAVKRVRAVADDEVVTGYSDVGQIDWGRRGWVVLLAGPIAFASALQLSLVVFMSHGLAEADRVTFAGVLMPLAWGALTTWALSDPNLMRKSAGIIGIGVVSAVAVAMLAGAQG